MTADPITPEERAVVEAYIQLDNAHFAVRAAIDWLPAPDTKEGAAARWKCRRIAAHCSAERWNRDGCDPLTLVDEMAAKDAEVAR